MRHFRFLAVFATALIAPSLMAAPLRHLPIGSAQEVVDHVRANIDGVSVEVGSIVGMAGQTPVLYSIPFSFSSYQKDDGTSESIAAVAKRSQAELEKLLGKMIRAAVDAVIYADPKSWTDKTVYIGYSLDKKLDPSARGPSTQEMIALLRSAPLSQDANGNLIVPDGFYSVKLEEAAVSREKIVLYLPGIVDATATLEVPNTDIIMTGGLTVNVERNMLYYPTHLMVWPRDRQGTVTLKYRGGKEETYQRPSGDLVEATLPDVRPLAIELVHNGVLIKVQASETDDIVIDFAPSISAVALWEELPKPTIVQAGVGTRTFFHERLGSRGFYQARRVPSQIHVR